MALNIKDVFLTPNDYSRPQNKIKSVKAIVIHYVANTKSSAMANRNFFENRKKGKDGYGSAHYIIDLDGSIIRCIPENEMAYHVGSETYTDRCLKELGSYPNSCTIGIECTHIDNSGKMSDKTYNALVDLCVELCKKYKLNPTTDLWTHKEVVGWKNCHKWFVENPNEWTKFKNLVKTTKDQLEKPTIPESNSSNNGGYITMADLNEIKKALNIPDATWAKTEISKAKANGLLNGDHDPNELVTMGVFMTLMNRLYDEIKKSK